MKGAPMRSIFRAAAAKVKRVSLGDCEVIGAASIMVSDIPKGAVVAGNPARILTMLGDRKPLEPHD